MANYKFTNKAHVEGYIFDHNLEEKVSQKGVPYVRGEVQVATDAEAMNVVPVFFTYVAETFGNGGKHNDTWDALHEIMEKGITYKDSGTSAWKVRIDGSVEVNEYYGRDGELISFKRMAGSFLHIQPNSYEISKDAATFTVDMIISNVVEREFNDETYLRLQGHIFNYRGDIFPIDFALRSPEGIKYFSSKEISKSEPMITRVMGNVNSSIVKIQRDNDTDEEMAWGAAPVSDVSTRTVRSWDVSGTSGKFCFEGWDDAEDVITKKEVKAAMDAREESLAEQKKRWDERNNSNAGKSGFPTQTEEASPSLVDDDDDDLLPF